MSGTGDPAQIRQDIDAAREDLGETVEALAAKTDVTGQAKRKLSEARDSKPALVIVGAVALGLGLLARRRRRSRGG